MNLLGGIDGFDNEPIPSFYFEISFVDNRLFGENGVGGMISAGIETIIQSGDTIAGAFHQVNNLKMNYTTESWNESGWGVPRHTFGKVETTPVELVRYLRPRHFANDSSLLGGLLGIATDPITGWCRQTMEAAKTWSQRITTKNVSIKILHPAGDGSVITGGSPKPVAGVQLIEAYPTRWEISSLDSMNDSDPVKETIELQYSEMVPLGLNSLTKSLMSLF